MEEDTRQFILTWGPHTETHTIASLREKYESKTSLFDVAGKVSGSDGDWSRGSAQRLDEVFSVIQPGEQWTCDDCTVSLADVPTEKVLA